MSKNVKQYLDLSTAHVTEWDNHQIEVMTRGLIYCPHPYGYWVHVPQAGEDLMEPYLKKARKCGFSEALCNAIRYAREQGCDWINFDQDADTCDDLPTHEW